MGWASGFRAGADMAQTAMDAYEKAKKQREIREIEQGLQGQQAEQQAALPAYEAEQQRLAGMTQPQFAAQQVGLGPAPMGSAQMSPVTAPPSAPMQPGLVDPQRAAAGIGLPGQMAPEPGTYSPVSGQALGLGAAPKPMSEYDMEMERANQLRARGYTELADEASGRARQVRLDQRQLDVDAENRRRWEAQFDYTRGRDEVADEQFDSEYELAQNQLKSLDDLRASMEANTENQINLRNLGVQQEQIPVMAKQAYTDSVLSGRNVMEVAGSPPEDFAKDPALSALWATTVMGQFREETGLNDGQLATLYSSVDNELNSIVSAPYDDVNAQAQAFSGFINKYVPDTNATDDYRPQLQADPERPGMFTLTNGPVNLNEQYLGSPEPRSLTEIGKAFQAKLKASPSTYALSYVDARQKALVRQAADLREEDAAREFLADAYKENPGLFGDKQSVDSLLEMAGFATGYDASAYTSGGAGGLKNVAPDQRTAQESTAAREPPRYTPAYQAGVELRRSLVDPALNVYGGVADVVSGVTGGLGRAAVDTVRGVTANPEGR